MWAGGGQLAGAEVAGSTHTHGGGQALAILEAVGMEMAGSL